MKVEVAVLCCVKVEVAVLSCVKVEVAVLGSSSLTSLMVSVDVKRHVYLTKKTVWFLWT